MADWEEQLTQAGFIISKPRRVVMDILVKSRIPLTPLEIFRMADANHYPIGMVSVYRSLDLLVKLGIIKRVQLLDGNLGYVVRSLSHSHHILCQSCKQVIEFTGTEDIHDLILRVEEETGFQVSDHLLQLIGTCSNCREKMRG